MPNQYCNFLIVGAMKAGTTSLYRDLQYHPHIFLPEQKEPEVLYKYNSDKEILFAYQRLMQKAKDFQKKGEASTAYTKQPDYHSVAGLAFRLLGPELKIIYLERDPIARAISHYRHNFIIGEENRDIDHALIFDEKYINYSRYDWQIKPWIETFGIQSVLRLSFEDYIVSRYSTIVKVCSHIGVDPFIYQKIKDVEVHNSSTDRYAETGIRKKLIHSNFFQVWIKPNIPGSIRRPLKKVFLRKAKSSQKDILQKTENELRKKLLMEIGQ